MRMKEVELLMQYCPCRLCSYMSGRKFTFESCVSLRTSEWRWRGALFLARIDIGEESFEQCCRDCVVLTSYARSAKLTTRDLGISVVDAHPSGKSGKSGIVLHIQDGAVPIAERTEAIHGITSPFPL
jgi:hypothetical protein